MATNTTYNPVTIGEFDSSKLQGYGQGVSSTCAANTTTNIDLALSDDVIITGIQYVISGASLGDYIDLKVLLTANGATVATPITNWFIPQTGSGDFSLVMPVKIVAGFTLRAVVHTTVILITPFVGINFKLWKVLS